MRRMSTQRMMQDLFLGMDWVTEIEASSLWGWEFLYREKNIYML